MYYPYLRGRQSELLALKELANRISDSGVICPIIEPVNLNPSTIKSFKSFVAAAMPFTLIMNPQCTRKIKTSEIIKELTDSILDGCESFSPALFVTPTTTAAIIHSFCTRFDGFNKSLIYGPGQIERKTSDGILENGTITKHVFLDDGSSKAFRSSLQSDTKILVKDAFHKKQKNSLYDPENFFSDAYLNFPNDSYAGFGDYSIVGKDYFEGGGQPYAVAIHHVFVNQRNDNSLHIKHYLSDRTESPTDTAGKFIEALDKLIADIPKLGKLNQTETLEEYKQLHAMGKFPGLPKAKRLGIQHHLEIILNNYALAH